MLYNESFEVIWGSKYMQMFHPHSIKKFYKDINLNDANEQLSSFWVKRVK